MAFLTDDNYKLSEVFVKNKLKIIGSLCLLILCLASVIINEIAYENNFKFIGIVISSLVAFADMFLGLIPCIFTQLSIDSSQIDPNRYSYKKRNFVDRRIIFADITKQIDSLEKVAENIMWIRLYGEDGIGKKTLVSKLFHKYRYPFNRFYFIEDEEKTSILKLLNNKYPLKNTSIYSEELYIHSLAKLHRTFVVFESKSCDINERVTRLLTKWCEMIKCKHKLILIDLDRTSEQTKMKNQTVVFEYKLGRLVEDDSKMLVSKLLKHNCLKADDIVQCADGLPAAIKTLCNYYMKAKERFESSDWIEVFLNLKNDTKKAFFDFCILSIVKRNFERNFAYNITNEEIIEYLIASNLLTNTTDDKLYVPMWINKTILLSQKYNKQLSNEIKFLSQKFILVGNEKQQITALVEKDPTNILAVLQSYINAGLLVQIKDFYSNLNISFDFNDTRHKQIMIIIMDVLLKLGEYGLFNNDFTKYKVPIHRELSYEDFRINLLIADYYHLTSQYDKSNAIYIMLMNTKLGHQNALEIKFNLAHNYRHMGKLDKARYDFIEIERVANHNSKFYIRAVTSRISIDYFKNNSFNADEALFELSSLPIQKEVEYNVYRHIANIYRRSEGDLNKAITFLQAKINNLNKTPLRIVYDYYFELAECYRHMCRENIFYYNDAILNYNYALIFAESNHDINLKLCAQFGKSLAFFQKGKDKKLLNKSINNLLNDAKISDVIYYAMLTVIDILNNDDSLLPTLANLGFNHYIKVLKSKEVNALHITVM